MPHAKALGNYCHFKKVKIQNMYWICPHQYVFSHLLQVREGCKDLLKHKLIRKWLNDKWGRLGVWLYLANLITYLLYIIILTTFALNLPNPQTCVDERSKHKYSMDNHEDVL